MGKPCTPRSCVRCAEPFLATLSQINRGVGLFCSRACSGNGKARQSVELTCRNCGSKFNLHPSRLRHGRGVFCSRACLNTLGANPDYFWERVDKNGPTPPHRRKLGRCYVWTASRNAEGYGLASYLGRKVLAHRLAFFLEKGRWPRRCVLHACDGGSIGCVRPSHMFTGSRADNLADMTSKGRRSFGVCHGERHPSAKLRDRDIPVIRARLAAGETQRSVAERFGVAKSTITWIALGKTHRRTPG